MDDQSRTVQIIVVDAFTTQPFAGNPAAVCFLGQPAPEAWMRAVAREMNLSETAFLVPTKGSRDRLHYDLRWFTPEVEVDLCGHATLAAAHVLAAQEYYLLTGGTAYFQTRSGELRARLDPAGLVLDFPATPAQPTGPPEGLLDALGLYEREVDAVGRGEFYVVVQIADPTRVKSIAPDFAALRQVDTRATIVTARTGPTSITSRVFGPAVGIDEDPVTGSAHCLLGPWWAAQLGTKTMRAHQASARGGELEVRVQPHERVELVGSAVTVWQGEIVGPGAR